MLIIRHCSFDISWKHVIEIFILNRGKFFKEIRIIVTSENLHKFVTCTSNGNRYILEGTIKEFQPLTATLPEDSYSLGNVKATRFR